LVQRQSQSTADGGRAGKIMEIPEVSQIVTRSPITPKSTARCINTQGNRPLELYLLRQAAGICWQTYTHVSKHVEMAVPEDAMLGRPNGGDQERPTPYVKGTQGNVVHLSRRIERPKAGRRIERFERETPEQFEKRAARIAELEIELGIF
jgi:hypothetical protein